MAKQEMDAQTLDEMRTANKPRPYDLSDREEIFRLARECAGYLHTCRGDHHGTDWEGRKFAIDALEAIWKGRFLPPKSDRDLAIEELRKKMEQQP